jgi:hypothetical protein
MGKTRTAVFWLAAYVSCRKREPKKRHHRYPGRHAMSVLSKYFTRWILKHPSELMPWATRAGQAGTRCRRRKERRRSNKAEVRIPD